VVRLELAGAAGVLGNPDGRCCNWPAAMCDEIASSLAMRCSAWSEKRSGHSGSPSFRGSVQICPVALRFTAVRIGNG